MNSTPSEPSFYCPDWSVLRIVGPDAAAFVHNMCTNDIKGLLAGEAREALFTDVKAHVQAHAIVCRGPVEAEPSFQVIVTSPAAAALASHLEKYHIREELTIEQAEDARVVLAWHGELAEATDNILPLISLGEQAALHVVPCGVSATDLFPHLVELTDAAFASRRVACRFPLDRVDVDDRNLPQELNRDDQLISFTKGCYLGQETVARIDALGRVNWLLVQVCLPAGEYAISSELRADEKVVGRITSIATSSDGAVALAYVRRGHNAAGAQLELPCGARAKVC